MRRCGQPSTPGRHPAYVSNGWQLRVSAVCVSCAVCLMCVCVIPVQCGRGFQDPVRNLSVKPNRYHAGAAHSTCMSCAPAAEVQKCT